MRVAIRADGGPDDGYGHLVRTGALAGKLLQQGRQVTYVTTTPEHVQSVCPDGVAVTSIDSRTDPTALLEAIDRDLDIVLLDTYDADETYQKSVSREYPLAVLSDDARYPIRADLLVNANLYARELDYEVVGDEPHLCLGPEYLLLRDEISALAKQEPPWRDEPERAIVTMGGSDIAELTPTVLRAFDGLDIRVDAIVGPGFSTAQERDIQAVAEDVSATVRASRDPDDLPKRMFEADFAVATASTTTYELLALGTPIVSTPTVDNQEPIARALANRDLTTVVDAANKQAEFATAIEQYIDNPKLRRTRRDRGRSLIDGCGTERTHREILSLVTENDSP